MAIDTSKIKTGTPQLSVGTLTGSMMNQAQELAILENSGVNILHLDVMDGQAWPKITVGASFLAGLETNLVKDVHLLTMNPEKQVAEFAAAGADIITIQVEHTEDIAGTLKSIGDAGVLRGLAIYPTSDFSLVTENIDSVDVAFVISIGPDTGKEAFFDIVKERVAKLRELKPELVIAIDGAVKKNNVGEIATLGADMIVTGSAVFDGNDAAQNIAEMKKSISEATAN
ncbi:hypothetical protein OAB00_03950 [Akkermansiaceae bacterium]|nr:hypothetical protein [Akkermansiaceae bacterium]